MRFPRKTTKANPPVRRGEPRHLRRFLRGSFHHYSSIFHGRRGPLVNWLFRILFGRADLTQEDREEIRQAATRGTICYVTRRPSRLEYLLLSYKFRRENLPFPQFCHYLSVYFWQPFRTFLRRVVGVTVSLLEGQGYPNPYTNGYVQQLVRERTPMLLPLQNARGLPRRFARGRRGVDALQELLRLRRESDLPIIMVPLTLVYGHKPDSETRSIWDMLAGPSEDPGPIRRLISTIRNRKAIYCKVGQPQDLEDLEEAARMQAPASVDPETEITYHIRRQLLESIDTERKIVLGPARKSRSEMIEMALHDRAFVAALMDYCKKNDAPFIATRRRARRYLEEMAADTSPGAIAFLRMIINRLLPRLYQSVEVDTKGIEQVRRVMRRTPVVFVPSHKSHIDYLILDYVLDRNHLFLPYTISGINLDHWPLGPLFRGAGALFIRRTFRGKRIYTLCFIKYLEICLREGVSLTFYVEGGRSRIGKLLPPKTGFLQFLLEAAAAINQQDIAFIPVSISYERIFEEPIYIDEAAGIPSEREKLGTFLRHRRRLARARGRVWIDFAAPLRLRDLNWMTRTDDPEGSEPRRRRQAELIAHHVTHEINKLQRVTPYAIVAEALLAGTRRGISSTTVKRRYETILDYLRHTETIVSEGNISVDAILATMVAEKILTTIRDEESQEQSYYSLEENKRLPLTIYANTVVPHHHYLSLTALTLLGVDGPRPFAELVEEFRFLVGLLRREFVFGKKPERTDADDQAALDRALGYFEGCGWLAKDDKGLVLTKEGISPAQTFAHITAAYVESYHLTARALLLRKAELFTDKEMIRLALSKGRRLVSLGELDHPEAVHKNLVENALIHFANLGLLRYRTEATDKTKLAGRNYQVADYVQLRAIVERTKRYLPDGGES